MYVNPQLRIFQPNFWRCKKCPRPDEIFWRLVWWHRGYCGLRWRSDRAGYLGGSIRVPAFMNNACGFKETAGRIRFVAGCWHLRYMVETDVISSTRDWMLSYYVLVIKKAFHFYGFVIGRPNVNQITCADK